MAWLVSEVPAVLSSVGFAVLLAETWKVIYGNVEGQPHQILFGLGLTSVKLGLGLDVSPAMAPHCKNAIQVMIAWLRSTSDDLKNGRTNAATVLFFKQVSSTPVKSQGTFVYAIDLGRASHRPPGQSAILATHRPRGRQRPP